VKSGENLSVIASRYKTTVKQIMNWNNLTSTNLKIGQKLILFKNGDRSSLEHFEFNAIIKVRIIDNNYS
jgi:LysM repeat protein